MQPTRPGKGSSTLEDDLSSSGCLDVRTAQRLLHSNDCLTPRSHQRPETTPRSGIGRPKIVPQMQPRRPWLLGLESLFSTGCPILCIPIVSVNPLVIHSPEMPRKHKGAGQGTPDRNVCSHRTPTTPRGHPDTPPPRGLQFSGPEAVGPKVYQGSGSPNLRTR